MVARQKALRPLPIRPALSPYQGRAVTVMGLGLFGGGVGAARYLARQGARVTVTDLKPAASLKPSLLALKGLPITFHLGRHAAADFTRADLVVVSPAVDKRKSKFVRMARKAGAGITSEMNLFAAACPAPIVGITGSNGKSTTTALVADMLRTHRPARLGGNIGKSLLDELAEIGPRETVVLELSSFQLEDLAAVGKSPHVAIVTNISPNHLDRHGTMRAYLSAKQNILRFQRAGDVAVLNADDPEVGTWKTKRCVRTVFFSAERRLARGVYADGTEIVFRLGRRTERVDMAGRNPLLGRHNVSNILAAAAAARVLGVPAKKIGHAISKFHALPHRLEPVGRCDGVLFINDSKATTPLAAKAAIEAFAEPVVLIAGGYDKHSSVQPMVGPIRRRARAVVLIGATAPKLAKAIGRGGPRVERAKTLRQAVRRAVALARPGDVVLLSTGHASWDMFDNYEQRGERFRQAALALGMKPYGKAR